MAAKKTPSSSEALVSKDKEKTKTKSSDFVVGVAQEVEGLSEKAAFARVPELVRAGGEADFILGGTLARIQSAGWLGEYQDFEDLCSGEFGIHPRKARYLINIYTKLVDKQIPWSAVKDVGWSKLREIVDVLTPKNAETWAARAKKLTAVNLIEQVRKAKSSGNTSGGSDMAEKDVSTLTFKAHKDQKKVIREGLDKMREEAGTDVDTVALTNIMAGYLGGTVKVEVEGVGGAGYKLPSSFKTKKAQVEYVGSVLETYGVDIVLKAFDKVWNKITLNVTMPEDDEGYGAPKEPAEAEE